MSKNRQATEIAEYINRRLAEFSTAEYIDILEELIVYLEASIEAAREELEQ